MSPLHPVTDGRHLLVRGVEYGRAYGSSQAAVKEEAARQTLEALIQDRRSRGYH